MTGYFGTDKVLGDKGFLAGVALVDRGMEIPGRSLSGTTEVGVEVIGLASSLMMNELVEDGTWIPIALLAALLRQLFSLVIVGVGPDNLENDPEEGRGSFFVE